MATAAVVLIVAPACQVTPPEGDAGRFDDYSPSFSPDGSRIVFVREQANDSDLYVVRLREPRPTMLIDVSQYDLDPVFSPDGRHVAFETSPNGFAQLHLVASRGGRAEPLSAIRDGWATFPAWSPDGTRIVYSCGRPSYEQADLCLLSSDGAWLGLLGDATQSQEIEPDWSPDGAVVAFASDRSGNSDLFAIDVRDGRLTQLTDDPGHDADPAWSPDGSTIAFTSDRQGSPHICVVDADGGDVRCLTEGVQPAWSPDGASLAFYGATPDGDRIFVAAADGTDVKQVT